MYKRAGSIVLGCALMMNLTGCGMISEWLGGAKEVAQQEFGAKELLRKYEWFKNASATLDKKRADIKVYEASLVNMVADYEGVKRSEWARTDRENMNQWRAELAGVKASYNSIAGQYNAQMAKANWAFTNKGSLPTGATQVLPRKVRNYVSQ